ncbi:MAG: four helix bundle protein [Pseudonocardiaceae bacterium]
MQDYRKLRVWQKAHRLTLDTYAVFARFTAPLTWPLRDQLLRAIISVRSNIAEGAGRGSDPDFHRFLLHSLGSLNEVEYDFLLARDLGFLEPADHRRLSSQLEEVRRMLSGLMAELRPADPNSARRRAGSGQPTTKAGSGKLIAGMERQEAES